MAQSQQQQQYHQRAFSPMPSVSSNHPPFLGPNKRQRLSPNPGSPYSSPSMSNIALPNQVFSSPFYGAQPNGTIASQPYHAPTPPPQTGAMGPPSRPADNKPTDMNELTDVLLGSGVDLKEEEAALLNRYNPSSQQQHDTSFATTLANSFNSFGSSSSGAGTLQGGNALSQNVPGDRNSFYGAGTFNQPPGPYQSPEERAEADRKRANQRKVERRQYHLNDPFLLTGWLQRRITKQANNLHVTVPTSGLLSTKQTDQSTEVAVSGPDQNEVVVTLRGQELLYHDAPLVEILTLLSLATEERVRALVEDAAALAKGRRIGSHGAVPPDLADLAVGADPFDSVTALPTPGNSAVSPKSSPLKRSYSTMNKPPTPISNGSGTPTTATAVSNPVVQTLSQLSRAERAAEEERLAKRASRATSGAAAADNNKSGMNSLTTSGANTPGLLGERAPDVENKRGSRKEQKKQAEAKATEAQQHVATTKTMNMALGIGGSLGKKLSWMQKDSPSGGGGGSFMLPRVNTSSHGAPRSSAASGAGAGSQLPMGRKHGEFREDKENGAGIQLRDLISVLDSDHKEKRALARAYTRLR